MLKVVQDRSEITTERGTVIVASDIGGPDFSAAFDELKDRRAIQLAMKYAETNGLTPAWLNGTVGSPFAVNSEGIPLEEVRENGKPLPQTHKLMQPHRYWIEIKLVRPIR